MRREIVNVSARFLLISTVGCLFLAFAEGPGVAQENTAPPLIRRPEPEFPGQPTTGPFRKVASTGLVENGGSIANGVYTNSIYGFSLNIPPGWVAVPPPATPPPVTPDPGKTLGSETPQPIRIILIVTENAPLKKNYERKSIQISVLQLGAPAGPHTARDFMVFAERTGQEKGLNVQYLGSPEALTINGRQLWKARMNETINRTVQHIEQYAATEGRTLLQFMLVSPEAEGLKGLQPSIQSLRFRSVAKKVATQKSAAKKSK